MLDFNSIIIETWKIRDLENYLYCKHPAREFHRFNGPYYKKLSEEELRAEIEDIRRALLKGEKNVLQNKKIVANKKTGEIIGEVNWYWKSEETLWMEIGIVIFNDDNWGSGIGSYVLKMWIEDIFDKNPKLVRLGLSTWSGNHRMMKLAEKLGLKKEAVYRKARIVDGEYYDAVSYGILREEWEVEKFL